MTHPQTNFKDGYDHPFVLNRKHEIYYAVLSLYDEVKSRKVEILTDRDSLVIYTHLE